MDHAILNVDVAQLSHEIRPAGPWALNPYIPGVKCAITLIIMGKQK